MAVLDLEMWVDVSDPVPKVVYSFYKKKIASVYTVMKRSAVSEKIKKDTLFQETLRRLFHVSPSLPWSETVTHLNTWTNCMRVSGYTHKERYDIVRGAVMRYENMKKMVAVAVLASIAGNHRSSVQK